MERCGGDLTEAHGVYRRLALYDMPWEARMGFMVAFYRTFAVPRIARLLDKTGVQSQEPLKRAVDTGLFMYELIDAGPSSERGRAVIRRLNQMHRMYEICDEDYGYVLRSFIVPTVRWFDRFGWRATRSEEREAITTFYRQVGHMMGLTSLPSSWAAAAEEFDAYEAAHVRWSAEGAHLMGRSVSVLASRMPKGTGALAPWVLSMMLPEGQVRAAVGLPEVPRGIREAFRAATRLRSVYLRNRPRPDKPFYRPGRSGSQVYPNGWNLDDLGPETFCHH